MITKNVLLAALLSLSPAPLFAQAPPSPMRGTIESVTDHTMTLKTADGTASVTLAEPFTVTAPKKLQLSDIKPGDFIGIAGEPKGEETQALAIQVFPANGSAPAGKRAWNLTPNSTMTNGSVTAENLSGRTLTLSFNGATSAFEVPTDAVVYTPVPATPADLKPGAKVFFFGAKGPDGHISTNKLLVSKDGIDPAS